MLFELLNIQKQKQVLSGKVDQENIKNENWNDVQSFKKVTWTKIC